MQDNRKYVVTFKTVVYHTVSVGIAAPYRDAAAETVRELLNLGMLWDDIPEISILYDDHTPTPDYDIQWEAVEVEAFPPQDPSVKALAAKEKAFDACRALVAAYEILRNHNGVRRGVSVWDSLDKAETLALEVLAVLGQKTMVEPPAKGVPPEPGLPETETEDKP
jgi:hypothetical protein